jgi:opacity protein-like surface antigen
MISAPLALAEESSVAVEEWEYRADIYLWGASVGGESASGGDIDIKFKDLAEDLDLGLMTSLAASKSKWTFEIDAIYLDVEDKGDFELDPVLALDNVELTGWIVTSFVAYNVLEGESGYLAMLAGARYLYLDLDLKLGTLPPQPPEKKTFSGSDDFWDGIVGVIGRVKLSDRWALPYYLDVGTGDTDMTWQVFGGVAYAFEKCELIAGYRYLDWDFKSDNKAFNDLNLSGPMLGVRFRF